MECDDSDFDLDFFGPHLDSGGSRFPSDKPMTAEQAKQAEQTHQEMLGAVVCVGVFAIVVFVIGRLIAAGKRYYSPARVEARKRAAQADRERWLSAIATRRQAREEREQQQREQQEESARIHREKEDRRTGITRLTLWYQDQLAEIRRAVAPSPTRDTLELTLWNRYDALLKEFLEETKP